MQIRILTSKDVETALPMPKAIEMMKSLPRSKNHMHQNWLDVMQKILQHCNPMFHSLHFNLAVENLIVKEQIF